MITKQTFWDKRIPTLLGLLLIVIGIGVTTYLAQIGALPFINAAPGENPKNIRVTNITDSSFTVTYTTDQSVVGTISVVSGGGQLFFDDRDNANTPVPHFLHTITVKNLQPKTSVSYSILSGKSTYLNKSSPFSQTTADKIAENLGSAPPITGKVVDTDGSTPDETLVYITTDGGQTVSTYSNPAGLYATSLLIRSQDFSSIISFSETSKLQLLIVGKEEASQVIVFANSTNPVPTITLSQNYDFTESQTPIASSSALPIVGFPSFGLDTTIVASESPKIDVPAQNETFTDTRPVLHGKVLPNETVSVTIHSDEKISTTVKADEYGNWSYQPPTGLSPGNHTITIVSKDQNGILKTVQKIFTILQSGTQVAEAATPSATLTPIIPTSTPIPPTPIKSGPTPTKVVPTPTGNAPSTTISPTSVLTSTIAPTSAVSPTSNNLPSPTKAIPNSGSEAGVIGAVLGAAAAFFGIAIIFFTHMPL